MQTSLFQGKRFLITGATGRLGVEVASRLEELGASVIPVVTPGYPERPERVRWKALTNPIMFDEFNAEKEAPDFVINLHWRVKRDIGFANQLLYETDYNISRLSRMWDSLKDLKIYNFVNISSIKIFGFLSGEKISADTPPVPDSPYGINKVTAESFFSSYFKSSFPVTHLRLCSVASVGEHPSQLMSRLYTSAFMGEKINIMKGQTTYLLYIDEAVDLIISSAINGTLQKYNIIPWYEGLFNEQIASLFEEISGRKLNADFSKLGQLEHTRMYKSNIEKLKAPWVRSFSIEDIIRNIIELNRHRLLRIAGIN